VHRFLRRAAERGARVLVGDPGRRYLPPEGLVRLASYDIVTTPELEEADLKHAGVFTYPPGFPEHPGLAREDLDRADS
jgi:predicted nicotinamide N-methyase